ncbi:MAG: hypothetical protein ACI9OJ_005832 [Myxococcota bacterium]
MAVVVIVAAAAAIVAAAAAIAGRFGSPSFLTGFSRSAFLF